MEPNSETTCQKDVPVNVVFHLSHQSYQQMVAFRARRVPVYPYPSPNIPVDPEQKKKRICLPTPPSARRRWFDIFRLPGRHWKPSKSMKITVTKHQPDGMWINICQMLEPQNLVKIDGWECRPNEMHKCLVHSYLPKQLRLQHSFAKRRIIECQVLIIEKHETKQPHVRQATGSSCSPLNH